MPNPPSKRAPFQSFQKSALIEGFNRYAQVKSFTETTPRFEIREFSKCVTAVTYARFSRPAAIPPCNCKVGSCSFSWHERDDNVRVEDMRNTAQEWQRVTLVAHLFDRRDRLLAAAHLFR